MIKRKFILILAFTIFIGSVKFTNLVHASENIDTGKMQVLKYLNIIDSIDDDTEITRGFFLDSTLKLCGINQADSTPKKSYFVDVDIESPWCKAVEYALDAGIISGYNTEFFRPDEKITYIHAAVMIERALGYADIAELKGGYPNGYLSAASECGLNKNIHIQSDAELDAAKFVQLMYNALNIKTIVWNGIGKKVSNKSLLDSMDIMIEEGVIDTIGYFSIYPDSHREEGCLSINRQSYKLDGLETDRNYIGKRVNALIDKSGDTYKIVSIFEKNNRETTVAFENINSISNDKLSYYTENHTLKSIQIDSSAKVLLNGNYYGNMTSADDNRLFDVCHTVVFIDNNSDGKADVINVVRRVNDVVEKISSEGDIILKYSSENLELLDDDVIYSIEKDDTAISLSMLKKDDVISVEKTEIENSKIIYRIIASDKTVTGKLISTENDENILYFDIDGEKYVVSAEYKDFMDNNTKEIKPQTGNTAVFYLSDDNKIVYSKIPQEYMYGYLIKVTNNQEDEAFLIKIYTTDGKEEEYSLAENVRIFSENYKSGIKKEARKAISDIETSLYEIAAYKINENSEITEFVIPIDRTAYKHGTLAYPLTLDFCRKTDSEWDPSTRLYKYVMGYKYSFDEKYTPFVFAPSRAEQKSDSRQYSIKHVKDIKLNTNDCFHSGTTVKLYNVDSLFEARLALIESDDSSSQSVENTVNFATVKTKTIALDEDEEVGVMLKYFYQGKEVSSFLAEDVKISSDDCSWDGTEGMRPEDLKFGDVFQFTLDATNKIKVMRILFNYNNRGEYRYKENNAKNTNYAFEELTLVYGKVVELGENSFVVTINSADNEKDLYPMILSRNYGAKYYYITDGDEKTIKSAVYDDIEKGDEVVIRKRYNEVCEVIILR